MTDPADLPPRDIPDDLVAYALIGGPWWARALFCDAPKGRCRSP